MIFFDILLILLSFYFLAIVCERYFIESLDLIAQKWKMNSDMAGATLMAVGSSAPELFIALFALFKVGSESIGAGTIVGSALFNVLVIIGASAVARKLIIVWQPIVRDLSFYTLSIILLIFSFKDGVISLVEIILFICLYVVYIFAVLLWRKFFPYHEETKDFALEVGKGLKKEEKKRSLFKSILFFMDNLLDRLFPNPQKNYKLTFLISILIISGLSWVLVESAVNLSFILNIPAVIVGLTILAIGTSIPDLISSIVVAKQGRGGMAISNSIGSNIFDVLLGLGLPWFIMAVFLKREIVVETENLNTSIFLLLATILVTMLLLIIRKWKIGKTAGFALIAIYLGYLIWAIAQAL